MRTSVAPPLRTTALRPGLTRRSVTSLVRAAAVTAVGAVLVVGTLATSAQAHDALVSVSPADRSTVAVAPDAVTLTFNEPAIALGTQIVVLAPNGRTVSMGDAVLNGSTVRQALSAGRPAGTYTVQWRVTAADGHPSSGQFTFTATSATAPPTPTQTASPTATGPAPTPSATPAPGSAAGSDPVSAPPGGVAPWAVAGGIGAAAILAALAVWWVRRPS